MNIVPKFRKACRDVSWGLNGVIHRETLEPPRFSFCEKESLSIRDLMKQKLVPQRTSCGGRAIAFCDSSTIDLDQYRGKGYALYQTCETSISRAWIQFWQHYSQAIPKEVEAIGILQKLGLDITALSSENALIGIPSETSYEIVAQGVQLRGAIDFRVYLFLRNYILSSRHLDIDCAEHSYRITAVPGTARSVFLMSAIGRKHPERTRRVLIIDDDPTLLRVLRAMLSAKQWDVTTAKSGAEAYSHISNIRTFDLIVTDLELPDATGQEILKAIQSAQKAWPVLVLTSDECSQTEVELAKLGASAFVRKSEDPAVLLAWCENVSRNPNVQSKSRVTEIH